MTINAFNGSVGDPTKAPQAAWRDWWLSRVAPVVLAAVIFLFDTLSPLQFAVAVLYVVVILMAASRCSRRGVIVAAIGCAFLTLVSHLIVHGADWTDSAPVRTLVSLSAIAITTLLALRNLNTMKVAQERARLLDLSRDAIFVHAWDGPITYWSRGAEELYGWSSVEALNKRPRDLVRTIFPTSSEAIREELSRHGRWDGDLIQTTKEGRSLAVCSRWALQRDEQGRPLAILETNTDVSDRKRRDAELRASERRYRNIFDAAGVAIWETDFKAVWTAMDALREEGISDLKPYLEARPSEVERIKGLVRMIDVNEAARQLFEGRTRSDLLVPIETFCGEEANPAFIEVMDALFRGRSSTSRETVLKTLTGASVSVLFSVTVVSGAGAEGTVLVSMTDVTERNRMELALNRATAELAHATRVATLGELTASIAHEVNQPLAAIVTNGEACVRWLGHGKPDLDEVRASVERMIVNGNRAAEVIARLRAMARKADPSYEILRLNEIVEQSVALVSREMSSHGVALNLDLGDLDPHVLGDRVQLQQVIINLLMNAAQAMAEVQDRPRLASLRTSACESGWMALDVSDAGFGLSPDVAPRVFDAFFSTKPGGMGMGLSICRSIVEAHGGSLTIVPKEDAGTTFRMKLQTAS